MAAPVADDVFRALADPTRRQILTLLAGGERSVGELVSHFEVSQPAISQHLAVLRGAGLVVDERAGRFRRYSLRAEALRDAAGWFRHFESFWDERLDALGRHLRSRP